MLVHLGTESVSKAYHLLDPTNQRIVISRDLIFDEDQGWNWNGKQDDNFGVFNHVLRSLVIKLYKKMRAWKKIKEIMVQLEL